MGADMMVEMVCINKRKKPNFKKGLLRLQALAKLPIEKWPTEYKERYDPDGQDTVALCAQLILDLATLEAAWKGEHREGASFEMGGKELLITGGLSWGDAPTELCNNIDRLRCAGVTVPCGFDY